MSVDHLADELILASDILWLAINLEHFNILIEPRLREMVLGNLLFDLVTLRVSWLLESDSLLLDD